MAPIPPSGADPTPRLVLYYQTMHRYHGGPASSLLPLLNRSTRVTHIILAALHLHADDPARIRLNDNAPSDSLFDTMWAETAVLRRRGVKIMMMLGGAAAGCYSRETLDAPSRDVFQRYYAPLRDLLRSRSIDGIDLDVEQEMSLPGIIRLIDALRADFGPGFLISLAPVAAAMLGMGNLSGFDYFDVEAARGDQIAWYNVQFYNNWGDAVTMLAPMGMLWKPEKVVIGQLTSPENGNAHQPLERLEMPIRAAQALGAKIGGVMGWEYFNSLPGGKEKPWLWAEKASEMLGLEGWPEDAREEDAMEEDAREEDAMEEDAREEGEAAVPDRFEYHSDGQL